MTTVSLPKGNIALGWADVGGQRVPVTIDEQWMRVFSDMVTRVGGPVGINTSAIAATAAEALALANSAQFSLYQRPQPMPVPTVDSSQMLNYRAFGRNPIPSQTPVDDAASILANRVFRK